jgi:two-component system, OmpR family, KDP operon response regulator KdpE
MAKILIVEDEIHLRQLMRHALSRDGHEVMAAENGIAAMMAMEVCLPDLVITDVAMPEMDGVSLLQTMRDTPEWSHIPVLLMSAFVTPEQLMHIRKLEGAISLSKANFSIKDLRAKIHEQLVQIGIPCETH